MQSRRGRKVAALRPRPAGDRWTASSSTRDQLWPLGTGHRRAFQAGLSRKGGGGEDARQARQRPRQPSRAGRRSAREEAAGEASAQGTGSPSRTRTTNKRRRLTGEGRVESVVNSRRSQANKKKAAVDAFGHPLPLVWLAVLLAAAVEKGVRLRRSSKGTAPVGSRSGQGEGGRGAAARGLECACSRSRRDRPRAG